MRQRDHILKLGYKALVIGLALMLLAPGLRAETFMQGEPVWPVFEGWRPNADGSFNLMFGYMNENWEEEHFVAVGEHNFFSPGDGDRGQPTFFMPRRNRFTFEVTVPADWGDRDWWLDRLRTDQHSSQSRRNRIRNYACCKPQTILRGAGPPFFSPTMLYCDP